MAQGVSHKAVVLRSRFFCAPMTCFWLPSKGREGLMHQGVEQYLRVFFTQSMSDLLHAFQLLRGLEPVITFFRLVVGHAHVIVGSTQCAMTRLWSVRYWIPFEVGDFKRHGRRDCWPTRGTGTEKSASLLLNSQVCHPRPLCVCGETAVHFCFVLQVVSRS